MLVVQKWVEVLRRKPKSNSHFGLVDSTEPPPGQATAVLAFRCGRGQKFTTPASGARADYGGRKRGRAGAQQLRGQILGGEVFVGYYYRQLGAAAEVVRGALGEESAAGVQVCVVTDSASAQEAAPSCQVSLCAVGNLATRCERQARAWGCFGRPSHTLSSRQGNGSVRYTSPFQRRAGRQSASV